MRKSRRLKRRRRKTRRLRGGDNIVRSTVSELLSHPVSPNPLSVYLQNVNGISEEVKERLVQTMFQTMGVLNPEHIQTSVQAAVRTLYHEKECEVPEDIWKPCSSTCYTTVSRLIKGEIESTAYILKALTASVIGTGPLQFGVTDPTQLTGRWAEDRTRIQIHTFGTTGSLSRLIMGFGPSASGKTYWANAIINIFRQTDPTFPTTFLSIDGGIYREQSSVYKAVVKAAKRFCIKGITNLVSSGLSMYSTLFNSDLIKGAMKDYLVSQKDRIPISLYVPETLGYCGLAGCPSKYRPYIDITNDVDSWIGLYIWQHREGGAKCEYSEPMTKCVGCMESGKRREIEEGKQYSSSAYSTSETNGLAEYRKAPGGSYDIHNCGRSDGISLLWDRSNHEPSIKKEAIKEAFRSNQERYKYRYLV